MIDSNYHDLKGCGGKRINNNNVKDMIIYILKNFSKYDEMGFLILNF
jgi:hypothetical protein